MKSRALLFLFFLFGSLCISHGATAAEPSNVLASLAKKLPPRPQGAMSGSEFARYVSGMDESRRERAIVSQVLAGNFPDFLRSLKPVSLTSRFRDGKTRTVTIFTMPDYMAIGSDSDYLLIPMNLYSAIEIAVKLGFTLPTRKMVDAVFRQSGAHFTPEPMQPGPWMSSTEYYAKHNRKIMEQRQTLHIQQGTLASGHKKDVVLSNRLASRQGKIAIYGWHKSSGAPIQPLSTVHQAEYADYSHGIRLVSDTVLIDNEPRDIRDVLQDSSLSELLSDEGPIKGLQKLLSTSSPRRSTSPES